MFNAFLCYYTTYFCLNVCFGFNSLATVILSNHFWTFFFLSSHRNHTLLMAIILVSSSFFFLDHNCSERKNKKMVKQLPSVRATGVLDRPITQDGHDLNKFKFKRTTKKRYVFYNFMTKTYDINRVWENENCRIQKKAQKKWYLNPKKHSNNILT